MAEWRRDRSCVYTYILSRAFILSADLGPSLYLGPGVLCQRTGQRDGERTRMNITSRTGRIHRDTLKHRINNVIGFDRYEQFDAVSERKVFRPLEWHRIESARLSLERVATTVCAKKKKQLYGIYPPSNGFYPPRDTPMRKGGTNLPECTKAI